MANMPRLAPAALLAVLLAPPAQADWTFTPEVSLTQTFTDNVGLQTRERARSRWVTQASPAFSVLHNGPRLKLSGSHEWNYFAYGKGLNPITDTRNSRRQYQGAAQASVIDDLLFVDASAERRSQSRSAFGPQHNNNPYALANSTDVSSWRISPYLRHRFGPTAEVSARYTRDSVDAGFGALGTSEGESVDLRLESGRLFNTLGWGMSYNRQDLDSGSAGSTTSESAGGHLSYRATRTLSLTATGGYDRYDYEAISGGPTEGPYWTAGFDWKPSSRTRMQLAGGRHFYGNTWDLKASHRSRRSVWSISYDDEITNTRSQFLRPSAMDTVAMVDELFRNAIRDPWERRQAVLAYMAANGLTPGLGDPAYYFSNRFLRQKGLRASVIFKGPRSNLALGAFNVRRSALSTADSVIVVPIPDQAMLNDNIHQRGLSAVMSYQVTSRSTATASLTASRNRSLITDLVSTNQALRLGMTRRFGQRSEASLEARHVRGNAEIGGSRKYHENAISATITMQYSAR